MVASQEGLLQLILDDTGLVKAVQDLAPRDLARLVRHIGLEDAGEVVALATTEQLARVFDEDLWQSDRPGAQERFDGERFGLWLEVLLEMGEARAAERLVHMDEDFVTSALAELVLVLDLDEIALSRWGRSERPGARDDLEDALADKALESSLNLELDKYLVIARAPTAWDAVVGLLCALDKDHHELLTRILDRLVYVSAEHIDDSGGLHEVLTAKEQLGADVAAAREARREAEGFVAPEAAASFLALARTEAVGADPITRAHLARLDELRLQAARTLPSAEVAPRGEALVRLLQEAEVLPRERQPLLLAGAGAGADELRGVRQGLGALRARDPGALHRRMAELGYLANVLVSGGRLDGRAFRPREAAEAAVATCDLGLDQLLLDDPRREPGDALSAHSLVPVFGVGLRLLHRLCLDVARQLEGALGGLLAGPNAPRDTWTRQQLEAVRARLRKDIDAGRPWRSRERLELLAALLAGPDLETLSGLIEEHPRFEGAFLSSLADLERARAWAQEPLATLAAGG